MPKRNSQKVQLPPEPISSELDEGLDAEELNLSTDEEVSDGGCSTPAASLPALAMQGCNQLKILQLLLCFKKGTWQQYAGAMTGCCADFIH